MRQKTYKPYIVVAYMSLFSLGLLDTARGPFFPGLTEDLGLTDFRASLFFVATSLCSFLTGQLVPLFVDRFKLINVVRLGLFVMGFGYFLIGLSTNLTQMLIYSSIFGLGFGLINIVQNLLILEGSSLTVRRQLYSGLHSFYALASLVGPFIISILVLLGVSWREGFMILSAVTLASLISTFFAKDQSSQVEAPKKSKISKKLYAEFLIVSAMLSFYMIAEISISTRLVLFLTRSYEVSVATGSVALGLFFLFLFSGRVLFAFKSFSLSNQKVMTISLWLSFLFYGAGVIIHPVFVVLSGLTMAPMFGVVMEYITDEYKDKATQALSVALAFSGLFIVAMHLLIGYLSDMIGIAKAMYVGPIFLLLSFAFLLIHQRVSSSRKMSNP